MPAEKDPPIQHRIVREPDRLGTMGLLMVSGDHHWICLLER